MRSPRAVNRRHVHCTPIHANHGKGQRTQAQRLAQKAIRQSLINQDPYSAKASEVFGQLDLKLAEFSKKAELSEEERLEKERRAALKKADKDAQVRAKKEAELRRKQEKLERKQAEAATKGEASDPKLDAITYVPPTLVAEESKPIKKNDSKKNKKSEKRAEEKPIVKIEEPPVVVVEQKNEEKSDKKSKKENKKDKKKSESESQSGVDEVKLFDATATPKNTPIDTPKEAPNTPAEYDLEPPHHQHHVDIQQAVEEKSKSKKSKKDKKQSESKTEPEEIKYSTPEVPQEEPVIEKVEHVKQETLPGLNGHHEEETPKDLPELLEPRSGQEDHFITEETEGELGRAENLRYDSNDFEIVDEHNPRFNDHLEETGVAPVKHWESSDLDFPSPSTDSPKEEDPQDDQKQGGLISTLTEAVTAVTEIWDDLTSGKSKETEEIVEEQVERKNIQELSETKPEPTVDIWEEFTSGKPLFKEEEPRVEPVVEKSDEKHIEETKYEEETKEEQGKKNKKNKDKKKKSNESVKEETRSPPKEEINVVEKQETAAEATPDIWEEFTSGKPLFKDNEKEEEPKEKGLISSLTEKVTEIWEDLTTGGQIQPEMEGEPIEKVYLEPLADEKPEQEKISHERTSSESQGKKNKKNKNKDKRSKQSSESQAKEVVEVEPVPEQQVQTAVTEPTPDIWEEFTSGKPLFKDEVKEEPKPIQETTYERAEKSPEVDHEESHGKKNKNKKNKDKKTKDSTESAQSAKEAEEKKVVIEKHGPSPASKTEVVVEEAEASGKKDKHDKKKDKRSKKSSESRSKTSPEPLLNRPLNADLRGAQAEISTASMDVNVPLNEDQEKFNETKPDHVEPIEADYNQREILPEEENEFVPVEAKKGKNKKKDKKTKSESEKGEELQTEQEKPREGGLIPTLTEKVTEIWEDLTTGVATHKDEIEKEPMEKVSDEPLAQEVHQRTSSESQGKKNKKNKNKKGKSTSESHDDSSPKKEADNYELALEKDIFQKLKPADQHSKKTKQHQIPDDTHSNCVWEGLINGVPIIKSVTSPLSSPVHTRKRIHEEDNIAELVEPLKQEKLAEPTPDIWEEFTSGKPLFKDEADITKEVLQNDPEILPAEFGSKVEPTPDIWEEFTSGKPLFKNDEKEEEPKEKGLISTLTEKVTEIWDDLTTGGTAQPEVENEPIEKVYQEPLNQEKTEQEKIGHERTSSESQGKKNKKNKNKDKRSKQSSESQAKETVEDKPVQVDQVQPPATEPTPDIWEEFTSGKPLFKDDEKEEEPKEKGLISSLTEKVAEIWEDLTTGEPIQKEEPISEPIEKVYIESLTQGTPGEQEKISHERTSGESQGKKNKKNKNKDKRSKQSSESQAKEAEQEKPVQEEPVKPTPSVPTTDIWEEFTSGKPLSQDEPPKTETSEVLELDYAQSKKPSNSPSLTPEEPQTVKVNPLSEGKKSKKDKKGKEKHQSESHEEVKIESVKPIDRVEEPVSIQIEEKDSSKKDKKKNKKEKRTSESQFSPDSGVVIEQETPLISPANLGNHAEVENAEVKVSAPPSHVMSEGGDIWEEFTSGKPLFNEAPETSQRTKSPAQEDISNFPIGHWETPTLELSSNEIWAEGASKKKSKHKEEPVSFPRPDYNTWDEVPAVKPEVKPERELEKVLKVPAPEASVDVWEEFTSGKPLFKEENKVQEQIKNLPHEKLLEEAMKVPSPHAPIDIWEEFTSGKPLFKDDEKENTPVPEVKTEAPVDIWEEFTSGKPLFKDDTEEEIPESLLKKAEEAIEASRKIWAEDQQYQAPSSESHDIWEEFTSGKPLFKNESPVIIEKHIDVEPETAKTTATVTKTQIRITGGHKHKHMRRLIDHRIETWHSFKGGYNAIVTEDQPDQRPTNVHRAESITLNLVYAGDGDKDEHEEEIKPEPTKESKNKKKDKKHKKSESEAHAEPEPVATKENGHIIDSAPIEKPEEAKELKYDEQVLTVDSKSKDKKDSKKKNKKGKTNSESESPKEKEKSPVKESAKTLEEIVIPESTKADPQASPSPTNGSSKRDKKKKGKGKENGSPTTVVEEKPSPVGSGRFNPVEEASYQHYEELASHGKKETTHQGHNGHLLKPKDLESATKAEQNHADEHGFEEQKGKKGRKKNKSRSSESHELNGKLDGAEELSYDRDDLNKLAAESTSGQPSPVSPVQVNEVTSTETEEGGQRVYRENIKAAYDVDPSIDPNAHPTQFAIQVQKLVESTLAASELKHADPNTERLQEWLTKLSVQAQLLRLKEHDDKPKHTYTIRPLTPLAFERHVTVEDLKPGALTPTPRERSYKLLPKDVLFCSYMIDSYGEDYEGMTKDAKNVYRENARSLQRKMRVFKESPHFETYKKAKETGRTVEEVLQEEAAAHA